MPSPFPGMDPYIESQWYWADCRARMLTYLRDELNGMLPDEYDVRVDLRNQLVEEFRQAYIKIVYGPGRALLTVIELLSSDNKAGPARKVHLADRASLLRQTVNLVELDLLIAGRRLPMAESLPRGDYYAFVSRWNRRPLTDIYPWTVRQSLPIIPIPLRDDEPDALLDLQAVFGLVYERGHYARVLEYDSPLQLPLDPKDRRWAMKLAKARKT